MNAELYERGISGLMRDSGKNMVLEVNDAIINRAPSLCICRF